MISHGYDEGGLGAAMMKVVLVQVAATRTASARTATTIRRILHRAGRLSAHCSDEDGP